MNFDVFNNVDIDVVDSATREVKQHISSHNKATRKMVEGILKFLRGKTLSGDFDAKKYIPCFIGYGDGGIIYSSNTDTVELEDSWDSVADYYSTDLCREIKNSRSRIRKVENTFQSHVSESFPNCGSSDSIIMYTEISPSSLNQKLTKDDVYITEFGLFPDDSSNGNLLAHVKLSSHTETHKADDIIKTAVNYSNTFKIQDDGTVIIEDVNENCHAVMTSGNITGSVNFIIDGVPLKVPFVNDLQNNLICTSNVSYSGTTYATEGELIGTFDDGSLTLSLDTDKPYIITKNTWKLVGEEPRRNTGRYWNGNTLKPPTVPPSQTWKDVAKKGTISISYGIPYQTFPNQTSTYLSILDDGSGTLVAGNSIISNPFQGGNKVVYIPERAVIGEIDYDTLTATIKEQYSTNVGPNNTDLTTELVTFKYIKQSYRGSSSSEIVDSCSVSISYDIVADFDLGYGVNDYIKVEQNDILCVKWMITVAAIGEDGIFYNDNVFDEFGNKVENKYIIPDDPVSNIITLQDSEQNQEVQI